MRGISLARRSDGAGKETFMKKLCIALLAFAVLTLSACGGTSSAPDAQNSQSPNVPAAAPQSGTSSAPDAQSSQSANVPASAPQSEAATNAAPAVQTAAVTESDAKSIALNSAGFSETDVTGLRVEIDRDDGRTEYDVEFYVGNVEYSYEIDAVSGEILSSEIDRD